MIRSTLLLGLLAVVLAACGGGDAPSPANAAAPAAPAVNLPIAKVELGPLDEAMAATGQTLFETRCAPCHRLEERYIGPALGDVLDHREPEYVMNMILAPEKMLQSDTTVQRLFSEYGVVMTNQNLKEEEARAILEYFRKSNP